MAACNHRTGTGERRHGMKVLQVSKTSEGAFWAVRQVAELVRHGVEVHVVLPDSSGAAVPAWQKTGAVLHSVDCGLPVWNPVNMARTAVSVRKLLNQVRPDLIHSHFVSTTVMLRLALGRNHPIPRVFQVPGPLHLEQGLTRQLEISTAGESDYWVASSRYTKRLYETARVPAKRLFLSYYSSETDLFSTQRTGYLRKKLNIPDQAFVVGNINLIYPPKKYLGHNVGLKCHEDVIEAISMAQRESGKVWGVLVGGTFFGSEKYEQKLRKLAEAKGRGQILMPGKFNADEVGWSWPDFDCAVHVPLSENCGGVVEPLLSGVPTIAGQVGGLPEVVQHERTGKTVAVRRPDLLARSILDALNHSDEHKSMAQRGRQLAAVMFDPERCAKEILSIYGHILQGRPRPEEFDSEAFVDSLAQSNSSNVSAHQAVAVSG
jgi:glycosyltransferase involved in cell wall biosynthesis